jgi:RNA polymerase sigma-70 factor, ECF subfamily
MTATERPEVVDLEPLRPAPIPDVWVESLSGPPGPGHDDALRRLHKLLLRAARHQVSQMYGRLPLVGGVRIEELINQAADEAMVAVLRNLSDFEGRSSFSTWAYKFGILHAAVEVRRSMWRHREVTLEGLPDPLSTGTSPEQFSEGRDFSEAVSDAIDRILSVHQRQVVIALLVDGVPIDVLADRLGTTRNALYKTVHDARRRLRRHLTSIGYLPAATSLEVTP